MAERQAKIEVEPRQPTTNHCGYCHSPTIAMHQVRTIDGEEEWVCGRHKRYISKTDLEARDNSRSEDDKSFADYMRDRLYTIEVERGATIDSEIKVSIKGVGPENWVISHLRRTIESRQQTILVTAFNAALNDVAEARQEGPDGFNRKVTDLTLSMVKCKDIENLDERQDRLCAILAYNHGLSVGVQVFG